MIPYRPSSFTINYNGRTNVLHSPVDVFIPSVSTNVQRNNKYRFRAIWDTGATNSVITKKIADELELKACSKTICNGVTGSKTVNVYMVCLLLPNNVSFRSVSVTECESLGAFDVLIGMDIIGNGDFAVSNLDGKTHMTFRLPSCENIDFVKNKVVRKPIISSKAPGRNDSCPCGSGKKYKNCCGKNK